MVCVLYKYNNEWVLFPNRRCNSTRSLVPVRTDVWAFVYDSVYVWSYRNGGIFIFSGRSRNLSIHHVRLSFCPRWSRWIRSSSNNDCSLKNAVKNANCIVFAKRYCSCSSSLSACVCAPANILNFGFLKKFVKHSEIQMKISERLYFRRRLSVVSRHDRHRIFL